MGNDITDGRRGAQHREKCRSTREDGNPAVGVGRDGRARTTQDGKPTTDSNHDTQQQQQHQQQQQQASDNKGAIMQLSGSRPHTKCRF